MEKDYVARVKEEYLTLEDIANSIDTSRVEKSFLIEYINNWVLRELLFQEAIKKNIITSEEYKRISEDSQKELANALLKQRILGEVKESYDTPELQSYYNEKQNEFVLSHNSFLLNQIRFNDIDRAILFRSTLLDSDWNKTSLAFRGDTTIISEIPNLFLYEHELHPLSLLRILRELMPNEVSIVLETEPNIFTVVQVVAKYSTGEIPPFTAIRTEVEKRYTALNKEVRLKEYLNSLHLKYDIEIKEINR